MDLALEREVIDLSRLHSPLRPNPTKWSSLQLASRLKSGLSYEIRDLDGQRLGLISNPNTGVVIGYRIEALQARLNLKRENMMFLAIYSLWKLVNPFTLKGITKVVYKSMLKTLYVSVLNREESDQDLDFMISKDVETDFDGHEALVFSEFYHAVFGCVDSVTRSRLLSEYARLMNKLAEAVSTAKWIFSADLHSRRHLMEKKELPKSYEGWMREMLQQFRAPRISPAPGVKRKYTPQSSPPRTAYRHSTAIRLSTVPSIPKDKDPSLSRPLFNTLRPSISRPRHRSSRHIEAAPPKHTNRFRLLRHLSLISPLSKIARATKRHPQVLEDILHKRSSELVGAVSLATARF